MELVGQSDSLVAVLSAKLPQNAGELLCFVILLNCIGLFRQFFVMHESPGNVPGELCLVVLGLLASIPTFEPCVLMIASAKS